jgi:hypothetical protein
VWTDPPAIVADGGVASGVSPSGAAVVVVAPGAARSGAGGDASGSTVGSTAGSAGARAGVGSAGALSAGAG